MMIDGKYVPNITCPICSHRHPPFVTCARAKQIADAQARERAEQEAKAAANRGAAHGLVMTTVIFEGEQWVRASDVIRSLQQRPAEQSTPVPMLLFCPNGHRHIDEGRFATEPHHTHACQACGIVWRPALADTVGVQFLPGFKNV